MGEISTLYTLTKQYDKAVKVLEDAAKLPEKYTQAVMDYLGQSNSVIMLVPFSDIFYSANVLNQEPYTLLLLSVTNASYGHLMHTLQAAALRAVQLLSSKSSF